MIEILLTNTVSFHHFKSQSFKLNVSNPKSKYVDYLSVMSQISNCQGLGRKNKHEILKTDRTSNLPTNIVPTNIAWLKLSRKSPVDMRIPPL